MWSLSGIVLIILFSLKDSNASESNTRIVGGANAPERRAPYQVSLRVPYHRCGGTILNSRWVMTAGHCINPKEPASRIKIKVGTNSLSNGGEDYSIKRIVVYPEYKGLLNDIALMEVDGEIKFNDRVRPIALPDKDTPNGANVMVTGWGRYDSQKDGLPDKLQMLNVTALSHEECLKRNRNVRKSELCTVGGSGKGVCMGDSGGPLVEGNAVVGIASYILNSCGAGLPDGFTRVFFYKDWVRKTIS